jgi:hypothetical protein
MRAAFSILEEAIEVIMESQYVLTKKPIVPYPSISELSQPSHRWSQYHFRKPNESKDSTEVQTSQLSCS